MGGKDCTTCTWRYLEKRKSYEIENIPYQCNFCENYNCWQAEYIDIKEIIEALKGINSIWSEGTNHLHLFIDTRIIDNTFYAVMYNEKNEPITLVEIKEKNKGKEIKEKKMFKDRLKEIRKQKGFSQKDLAELIGVSRPIISLYEAGKRQPFCKNYKKILKALSVTEEELPLRKDQAIIKKHDVLEKNYGILEVVLEKKEKTIIELQQEINVLDKKLAREFQRNQSFEEVRQRLYTEIKDKDKRISKLEAQVQTFMKIQKEFNKT